MKKTIKSLTFVLIAIILCFSTVTSAFASATIPNATSDFYVNDFANVFTSEEKSTLMKNAVTLADENNGVQVVISTVKSLDGDSVESYANKMYNQYGIGKDDMGLLILLSTGDRKIRVEVGRNMEKYINDAKAGRFIDKHAIPYLKQNKFNEGLINLQKELINEIKTSLKSESAVSTTENEPVNIDFSILFLVIACILLAILIIFGIYKLIKYFKKKKEYISNLLTEIENLKSEKSKITDHHLLEIRNFNSTIKTLRLEKSNLKLSYNDAKRKLANIEDRYNRVLLIYPDADNKVDAMIEAEIIEREKKAAKSVDDLVSEVINLDANKNLVDKLNSIISKYRSLTDSERKYIVSDIEKLNCLYNQSVKLKEDYEEELERERIRILTEERKKKAANVSRKISAIISAIGIAKAHDLYKLNDAKRLYDNLDYDTRDFVDSSVISKLTSLIDDAKRDKEEEEEREEQERRRRQSSYSSSSYSSSSHSSFGGFGGDSNGGGASRGF